MTACDSCFFAKKENLLDRHRWQFLTSDPRFKEYMGLQCQGNHEHVWKQTSERKREYPSAMIRRLVNGFVHDLRPSQLHMFLSEADRILSSSPAVFVASSAQETEKDISPAERERVRKLIHRLHVSGGHVSKTSLRLLLQRRGCPVWMQQMVDQLQCDSCLESSDAQSARAAYTTSLAGDASKTVAGGEDRYFPIRRFPKERFFALYMDAACKLSSCSCFLEGNPRQRFEPHGATLISHLAKDWMQHFPLFQFLMLDPGGCFVSNELREWASIRGIGLLTAPREFHGLTADLENLIRVIKRLARKLADDHPSLTLASCVSLACFSHNNGFKTGGYSPVQWAFGADNEGHDFTTMPSEIETLRMSAMNRYLQEQAKDATSRAQHTIRKGNGNLEPGTWVMYFRRGKVTRGAIGAPSKSGLRLGPARVIMTEAIQQWSGSVHSTTGQIGVVWLSHGNKLIRCHPTQLRRCSEREVSIASLKGLVQISVPTSVTELTNALSPGQYEDWSTDLPTRDDLRFGEVDLEVPPVDQERKPWHLLMYCCFLLAPLSLSYKTRLLDYHPYRILFLHLLFASLMCKLVNLL